MLAQSAAKCDKARTSDIVLEVPGGFVMRMNEERFKVCQATPPQGAVTLGLGVLVILLMFTAAVLYVLGMDTPRDAKFAGLAVLLITAALVSSVGLIGFYVAVFAVICRYRVTVDLEREICVFQSIPGLGDVAAFSGVRLVVLDSAPTWGGWSYSVSLELHNGRRCFVFGVERPDSRNGCLVRELQVIGFDTICWFFFEPKGDTTMFSAVRTIFCLLLIPALLCGCQGQENEAELGGPGATDELPTGERPDPVESRAFELTLPEDELGLARGGQEQVTVSIDRGEDFDQTVTLTFLATAEGVTVTPAEATLDHDQEELEITIAATPEAPVGRTSISVLGKPETGESVSAAINVVVGEEE